MPHLVVPQVACDEPRQPEPAHDVVLVASRVLLERVQRTPQRRHAGDVALREPRRQTVEEEVGRSWRLSSRRSTPSGRGHLSRADAAIEAAGEDRGSERFQVRLARRSTVEWLELLGCIEQQRRSVAAAPEREHDLGAQASEPGALEVVQRAPLRVRQKLLRGLRRSGLELRLSRGERAATTTGRIRGQLCRSLEERGRGGDAAASLRAPGRALQFVGDGLVETRSRVRAMPCAPIGIDFGIGRLGQSAMHLPGGRVRAPPGRPPSAPGGDGTAPGHRGRSTLRPAQVLRRRSRARARRPRATARSRRLPARPPRSAAVVGSRPEATRACRRKLCSIRFASGVTSGSPNPPASSAGRQTPRQLEQGERVSVATRRSTRSRTCSSRRPGHAESSSARASLVPEPSRA